MKTLNVKNFVLVTVIVGGVFATSRGVRNRRVLALKENPVSIPLPLSYPPMHCKLLGFFFFFSNMTKSYVLVQYMYNMCLMF